MGIGPIELLMILLICVVLFGGIVWLLLRGVVGSRRDAVAPGQDPLDILRERYARGELTREQYQQMREDLSDRLGQGSRRI